MDIGISNAAPGDKYVTGRNGDFEGMDLALFSLLGVDNVALRAAQIRYSLANFVLAVKGFKRRERHAGRRR